MSVCKNFFVNFNINAMNDNEQQSGIRAGKAFRASIADEPLAHQSLAIAKGRLRLFAEGLRAIGATHREAMEQMEQYFAALNRITKSVDIDPAEFAKAELDDLRGKQRQAFLELANEIEASQHEMKINLAAHGFDPP